MRQIIIYPGEDGYWVAECPSLPGCISQGKTKEEAVTNIDGLVKSQKASFSVIPAKAGIQLNQHVLDPGLRRGDD
jgi:hypothetical protein